MREAAALTTQVTGEIIPSDKPGVLSLAVRQPAGVVLGFAPWNAPVILGVRAIAAPLACGNTVILRRPRSAPRRTASSSRSSLVSLAAAERMDELIGDAKAKGAIVAAGGKRNGSIVEATIVDRVTPAMRIYKEESFGPVKPVIRVKDDEEAIRVANDTEYGLSSAVFSRDVQRALRVAKRIESGICHINGPTVHDEGQMPFGGVKASGYGRFGGKAVIAEFTDLRWITIEGPQHYPF